MSSIMSAKVSGLMTSVFQYLIIILFSFVLILFFLLLSFCIVIMFSLFIFFIPVLLLCSIIIDLAY